MLTEYCYSIESSKIQYNDSNQYIIIVFQNVGITSASAWQRKNKVKT